MSMTPQTDILTVEDLHLYLRIPKPTLYVLAQSGRIPAAKIGRHWRFRRIDIDEWIRAQQWASRPLQRRHRKPKAGDAATA
jgi:excisionase family DNA binding protein